MPGVVFQVIFGDRGAPEGILRLIWGSLISSDPRDSELARRWVIFVSVRMQLTVIGFNDTNRHFCYKRKSYAVIFFDRRAIANHARKTRPDCRNQRREI